MNKFLRTLALSLAWLITLSATAWAFGAVQYDFPVMKSTAAWVFLLAIIGGIMVVRGVWRKISIPLLGFLVVLAWWLTLKPTNKGKWQPNVAETAWAEIHGDEVTLHNVRNCDYRTETDFTPRWETRSVRISQITGVDMAVNYWGSPWMAHPVMSFQFADAPPVCFSIETRKQVGQSYSAIGGVYRQFSLTYIVADERDVIRVRTNYRKGEDVYLYRTTLTASHAQERFREYLQSINQMRDQPRWYNAITTNCTTSIRQQHASEKRAPWDWRLLVNGKGDELMYERRGIVTAGLAFPELKKRALINTAAQAANDSRISPNSSAPDGRASSGEFIHCQKL